MEISYIMEILSLTQVNGEVILRSKGQRSRSLGRKCRNSCSRILCEKRIDLHQANAKVALSSQIVKYVLPAQTPNFCNICLCFKLKIFSCEKLKNRAPLISISLGTQNTPTILSHDSQKLRVVADIFPLEIDKFLAGVFLKVHLTMATNRTWSAFVPFCRRSCMRDTASFSRNFPYLCN